MSAKTRYEIDGARFSTLEEFYAEISRVLIPDAEWGHNLDALNDILRGGFGTPDGGFVLNWKNAQLSRERLGYVETTRQLKKRLRVCHPTNREQIKHDLKCAQDGTGPTVFDWLLEIIELHGTGGAEEQDGVELILD